MANTLRIKRSSITTVVPTTLLEGELAANILDQKVWIGSSTNTPVVLSDYKNTFVYQGDWDLAVNYKKNDVVKRNGIFYLTLHPVANNGPDPATNNEVDWLIFSNPAGGGISLTDISSSAVGLNYDYTTGNFSTSQGYEIPLTSTLSSITTAYNERLQWDGSATSLITATGRTSLGINAVENTALSTWAGSTNITTVGSASTRNLTIAPLSQSATTASKCLTVTAPAHTNLTQGSECIDIDINLARTVSFAWAQTPLQKGIRIQAPTYSIVGSTMAGMTGAATVHIDSAPIAGNSINISYSYALRVLTGTTAGHGITVLGANGQTGNLFQAQVYSTNFINFANVFTISSNGNVLLGPTGTAAGSTNNLHFQELAANGSQSVGFKAPDSIASTVIWTLPAADGTAGQVLSTNASGVLSWSSVGVGTVTSIATTSPITGGTITGTGTIGINAASANTASYVVQRDASGNFSAGKITLENSGSSTSAQLTFSGSTNNWIDLGTNGYAAPAFTTRSVGTKVVFYKDLGASSTDYAAGIEMNALWFSIPAATSDRAFKFYGGTTSIASLTGDGNFSANKKITGETLSSTVATGTAPITVTSTTKVANLNAAFATSLAGGGAGQVPYNTASGATSFLAAGTAGQVLQSNGTSAPSWSAVTAGSSVTTSATAPATPTEGNQWYDTTTGIIYTYVNDGTSSQWVQGSTATLAAGVPAGGTTNQFLVKSSATDYATAWTGTLLNPTFTNYTETLYDAGTGSAFTLNLSNGTIQKFTTNANMTLTLPASTAGKSFVVMVVYGAVNTLTWSSPSTLKWVGGTTPTATSVAGKIDIFSFFQDGTNTYGTVYGLNF